jgi:colanic acid biosynthesis protein WcaH
MSPRLPPHVPPRLPPSLLSHAELDTVIRLAPLIAIDLIIRNARDEVLLGLRKNEPAKGCYFVPGGVILKNERLADAFARLIKNETDHAARLDDARLIGVYEHFYDNNRSGNGGYGTHYVVLGYEFSMAGRSLAEAGRPTQRTALVGRGRAIGVRPRARKCQGLFPPARNAKRSPMLKRNDFTFTGISL